MENPKGPCLLAMNITANDVFAVLSNGNIDDPAPYLLFWSTWGASAYEAISNGVPCAPPPDIVVHVGGEAFPFHNRLLRDVCPLSAIWPHINNGNIESVCRGSSHFRAVRRFIYTGDRKHLWDYLFTGIPVDNSPWAVERAEFLSALQSLDTRELYDLVYRVHDFLFIVEGTVTLDSFIGRQLHLVVSDAWDCFVVPKELQVQWGNEMLNEHWEEQRCNAVIRELRDVDHCVRDLCLG